MVHAGALVAMLALLTGAGTAAASDPGQEAPAPSHSHAKPYSPPVGSNAVFHESLAAAPGHELIVSDLNLPGGSVGDAHYHPWEEYLYVIGGSAVLSVEGQEERVLNAGEHVVIPRQTVHTPRAGPSGVRAIVIRVHDAGDPVSVPAGR